MIKRILRIMAVISLTGFSMFALIYITGSEQWVMTAQNSSPMLKNFFAIFGVIHAVVILSFWFITFYHWGTSQFLTKTYKRIWFFVILIGMFISFIGPLVYYVVVVEMSKGLKTDGK